MAFVDGDDALDPDMYERLLNNAEKYDADISHCGVRFCFWTDMKKHIMGQENSRSEQL